MWVLAILNDKTLIHHDLSPLVLQDIVYSTYKTHQAVERSIDVFPPQFSIWRRLNVQPEQADDKTYKQPPNHD